MYDARPKIDRLGQGGRLALACLSGCAIIAILGMLVLWPSPKHTKAVPAAQHQLNLVKAETGSILQTALNGFDISGFERALTRFDQDAYHRLEGKLQHTQNRTQALSVVTSQMKELFAEEAHLLERIDTEAIDSMLTLTQAHLKAASQAGNPYCEARHYMALTAAPNHRHALNQLADTLPIRVPEASQYGFALMTILLDAANEARRAPIIHGQLTHVNRETVQLLIDSLSSDPQIAPLLQPRAQTPGSAIDQDLAPNDICATGAFVIMASKTLPQATKGRLWADFVRGGSGLKGSNRNN